MAGSPERTRSTRRILEAAAAALLYAVLTIALAWPLSRHPATTVLWLGADTELFMWTLAWDAHAFVTAPLSIFDANIFYPEPRTLAYSEHLIGSAFFAAPVLWLTGNPVLAMNLTALLTVVLCGTGTYVLARQLGIGVAGALVAGGIFAFSPPRFFRLGQLHMTAVQWIPFGLAFLHRYFDGRRAADLRLAAACFALQALSSGHGTIFLGLSMAALFAWRAAMGQDVSLARLVRDLGISGTALLAPVALVAIPYRIVQNEIGLRRSLVDWVVNWQSFLASPARMQTWLLSYFPAARVNEIAQAYLFPGWLPLLLAAIALLTTRIPVAAADPRGSRATRVAAFALTAAALGALSVAAYVTWAGPIRVRAGGALLFSARDAWRPWAYGAGALAARLLFTRWQPLGLRRSFGRAWDTLALWREALRDSMMGFYAFLTGLSILLSIGPPLGVWPLVYWLPGFNFIRVPSRFMILALLGIAILAGIGFDRLRRRMSFRAGGALALALGAAVLGELAVAPLDPTPYRLEIPAVDHWLARQPGRFAIAEFPAPGTRGGLPAARQQTVYMVHSTAHWRKTIHGHSGIEPEGHARLYARLVDFPSEDSLRALLDVGVKYVVVHPDLYPAAEWAAVEQRLRAFDNQLTLEDPEDGGRVYSLRAAPK